MSKNTITIRTKSHGCLWWIFIGWWYYMLQGFVVALFGYTFKKKKR